MLKLEVSSIKDDLASFIEGLGTEFNVKVEFENKINKVSGRPVNEYGGVLESGEYDEPYATAVGETYKFIEPAMEISSGTIENFAIRNVLSRGGVKLAVANISEELKDSIEEEIINKINFDNTRENMTLKRTMRLLESIKTDKEIIKKQGKRYFVYRENLNKRKIRKTDETMRKRGKK